MQQTSKILDDMEEFGFYLSAFLSAGRSVTFAHQIEQKELYDAWFPSWLNHLSTSDRELLDAFNQEFSVTGAQGITIVFHHDLVTHGFTPGVGGVDHSSAFKGDFPTTCLS